MSKPVVPIIEYHTGAVPTPKAQLLNVAIFCAIIPILCGVAISGLWALTGSDLFPTLGAITFFGGMVVNFTGLICLSNYHSANRHFHAEHRKLVRFQVTWTGVLLFLNYPMIIACVAFAYWARPPF